MGKEQGASCCCRSRKEEERDLLKEMPHKGMGHQLLVRLDGLLQRLRWSGSSTRWHAWRMHLEEEVQLGQGQVAVWMSCHSQRHNGLQDQHVLCWGRLLCGLQSCAVTMHQEGQGLCLDLGVHLSHELLDLHGGSLPLYLGGTFHNHAI